MQDLYMNNHASFIHNCKKWETTQAFKSWRDKFVAVYSYNRILANNKNE